MYQISAVAIIASNGDSSDVEDKKFKVASKDQGMVVELHGPSKAKKIFADRAVNLEARIKLCKPLRKGRKKKEKEEVKVEERLRFFWSTDGSLKGGIDLSKMDAQKIYLERGTLLGGTQYTFKVNVVPERDPSLAIEAVKIVEVASKGVRAKLASKKLTFGTETPITLDGSLSIDLDNRDGDLTVKYFISVFFPR